MEFTALRTGKVMGTAPRGSQLGRSRTRLCIHAGSTLKPSRGPGRLQPLDGIDKQLV